MLHILENLERCFNKYIRIIYNWHTLCLNANTAVKVVLKNSLLAFFSYRRTFLSFTLLSCLADPYLSYNASVICPICPNAHRSELMKSELEGLLAASCGDKHLKTTPPISFKDTTSSLLLLSSTHFVCVSVLAFKRDRGRKTQKCILRTFE